MKSTIIVVEGIHDLARIKQIYKNANILITDGSNVKDEFIEMLKKLSKDNKIIIFTDPDYPGERIRKIISQNIENVSHAFLQKNKCISKNKKKVGIEHASLEDIKEALDNVYEVKEYGNLTIIDLYELGLVGKNNSSILRNKITTRLNIGKTNAKTFLNRINSFGITKDELEEIICKIENLKN